MKSSFLNDLIIGALMGVGTGVIGSILSEPFAAGLKMLGSGTINMPFTYTAGIGFALGFGLLAFIRVSMEMWKIILGILLTPGLYYLAITLTMTVAGLIEIGPDLMVPGFIGGAAGAAMLTTYWVLVSQIQNKLLLIVQVSIFGGISGMISLPFINDLPDTIGLLIIHVPWHLGVMALLFSGISRQAKEV